MDLLEWNMKYSLWALKPEVYKDAELRAAEALKFFKDVLKIKHVEVLRNLSRD